MSSTPIYQFKPFYCHIDGGFGAIGEAFRSAAVRLDEENESEKFSNPSLPIGYLHRHATELFLKSCIIVIHRSLDIPFDTEGSNGKPSIRVGQNWVPIFRVHNVGELYRYLMLLFIENKVALDEHTDTDWNTIPNKLEHWISEIEIFDERSIFFRYPGAGDDMKSEFRDSSVSEIWSSLAPDSKPLKGFIELDEGERIVSAFCIDPSRLEPILDCLRKASKALSVLHFAVRCELANGN